LTDKQSRFVDEYLVDLNATGAAIRAGYSARTARSIGQENLTKPDIAARISERQQELGVQAEVTSERVVSALAEIAFGDARCSDRLRALELLGKRIGLFEPKPAPEVPHRFTLDLGSRPPPWAKGTDGR